MTYRCWHYLRRPRSAAWPDAIIIVDTEGVLASDALPAGRQAQRFAVACSTVLCPRGERWVWDQVHTHRDAAAWWTHLERLLGRYRRPWLVGHGISYDLTTLGAWQRWCGAGWRVTRAVISDRVLSLRVRHGRRSLVVTDSRNWLPLPLRLLGDWTQRPKLPRPPDDAPPRALAEYCRRDVEVLADVVARICDYWCGAGYGPLATTAAGLAWAAWRQRWMPDGIVVHDHDDALLLERAAYYPGRVEAYRTGDIAGPVSLIDRTSAYPAEMRDHCYPGRLIATGYGRPGPRWLRVARAGGMVASVVVHTEQPCYPLRVTQHVIYPIGTYHTVLCGPELAHAVEHDAVRAWYGWCAYRLIDLFGPMMSVLLPERVAASRRGDGIISALLKQALNALAGKYGQVAHAWRDDPTVIVEAPWCHWHELRPESGDVCYYRTIGWRPQRRVDIGDAWHAMPAVSAWIAAHARRTLWDTMSQLRPSEVHYAAVDALLLSAAGREQLTAQAGLCGADPGQWRIAIVADRAAVYGPRAYQLGGATAIAGLRRGARQVGERAWEWTQLCGLPGQSPLALQGLVEVRTHRFTLADPETLGPVDSEGRHRPWQLPAEWEQLTAALRRADQEVHSGSADIGVSVPR